MKKNGFLLGKFLPPHNGHRFMCDFALGFCDHLFILVCSLSNEPIDGKLRYKWMKEMFAAYGNRVTIRHLDKVMPQEPSEHPDFWKIWRDECYDQCTKNMTHDRQPNFVFASEEYGMPLAAELQKKYEEVSGLPYSIEFIPVNIDRSIIPVSGAAIRNDPYSNWEFIPREVRPHFVKKIVIYGTESCGKTTVTKALAEEYKTVWCNEYARSYLEKQTGDPTYEMIERIFTGHMAQEDALLKVANKILFIDTDVITTKVWSEFFFGKSYPALDHACETRPYDLHIVLDTDIPFVPDPQRYGGDVRQIGTETFVKMLEHYNRKYIVIRASKHEDRMALIRHEIAKLFNRDD